MKRNLYLSILTISLMFFVSSFVSASGKKAEKVSNNNVFEILIFVNSHLPVFINDDE